jgi:hypothetical protein
MRPFFIEPKFMKTLGYELISDVDGYLKYENVAGTKCKGYGIMPKGLRTIYFNTTYAKDAVFMGIRSDGDTRTCYNGVVGTPHDMLVIINNVR